MRLTRRYRFAASHRLHSPLLSEEENRETYGKCDNPFGHGHDYILEVSVRGPVDENSGLVVDLARLDQYVERQVLVQYQHQNMNTQIPAFSETVPTTENVAIDIEGRLSGQWRQVFPGAKARLEKIRLYETRKNIIELRGDQSWERAAQS